MDGPRAAAGATPARDSSFELTFRVDAGDYKAFLGKAQWRAIERFVALLPAFGIGALGAVIGMFAAIATGRADDPVWFAFAVLIGALILYLVYRFVLMPAYYASVFSGQPVALGDNKVVVDTRGIAANLADVVIATPWPRVRVIETDRHVFLMLSRLAPIIVPKRAFVSAEEA